MVGLDTFGRPEVSASSCVQCIKTEKDEREIKEQSGMDQSKKRVAGVRSSWCHQLRLPRLVFEPTSLRCINGILELMFITKYFSKVSQNLNRRSKLAGNGLIKGVLCTAKKSPPPPFFCGTQRPLADHSSTY